MQQEAIDDSEIESAAAVASAALLALLDRLGLEHHVVEHAPVYTIAEALALGPVLDGAMSKNVFLRDGKGLRHFLLVLPHERRVDLAALAQALSVSKLSMGSPERLLRHLGITPGAVSVFAVVNDPRQTVQLIIDDSIWRAARIQAHPLRNTATVSLSHAALEGFLAHLGRTAQVMRIP
ncbi:prolyl-tRNA synthetase associated domain-containing protein [Janthinobacterium sp. CG3]|uniref:prolyl-tRNA synthetase associated domain-containing protein n=1 Tax=Janthinobacterium sp. CG3 TaxID=1075768 RepID=UPI00034D5F9C|nr:prolyl-tRNA synthetase associated domain-containing protein [Janthinobacterium sp. CG3]